MSIKMCKIIVFSYRTSNHPVLLLDIRKADSIMESLVFGPYMLKNWPTINSCRLVFSNANSSFHCD